MTKASSIVDDASDLVTTEWHAPVAAFAKAHGYVFRGELVFCTVKAPIRGTTVDLWISAMGRSSQTVSTIAAVDG